MCCTSGLHVACKFGHLDVVKELIAAGVDINAQTTAGSNTALIYAAYQGHDEVVHELLAAGADAHLPNNGYIDNTALAAAIRSESIGPPFGVDPARDERYRRTIVMLKARNVPHTATNAQVRLIEETRRKIMADERRRELRERDARESRERASKAQRAEPFRMPDDARIDLSARDFWRREALLAPPRRPRE